MATTELAAYLAISLPYKRDPRQCQSWMYKSLDELCGLSGQLDSPLFPLEGFGSCRPTIERLEHNKRGRDAPKNFFSKKELDTCEVLKISVKVPLPSKVPSWVTPKNPISPAGLRDIYLFLIRESFRKRIYDLLMIANLARIGSLEIHDSWLMQDGKKEKKAFALNVSEFRFALELAEKIGWPKLKSLRIARAWKWALQKAGFISGFSDDATSRALNAFTHLFKLNDGPVTLFWAIMGIEALYVKGREPKMEQVRERTQVLLGEQMSFKKKISEMYNFRSSFIHGDLNFPGRHIFQDGLPQVESHDTLLNDSSSLAIAVLSATLQVLIARNWEGLKFSYTVANIEKSS